jgi:hypothetical protein
VLWTERFIRKGLCAVPHWRCRVPIMSVAVYLKVSLPPKTMQEDRRCWQIIPFKTCQGLLTTRRILSRVVFADTVGSLQFMLLTLLTRDVNLLTGHRMMLVDLWWVCRSILVPFFWSSLVGVTGVAMWRLRVVCSTSLWNISQIVTLLSYSENAGAIGVLFKQDFTRSHGKECQYRLFWYKSKYRVVCHLQSCAD